MSIFGRQITKKNKLTVFCYHDVTNNPAVFSKKYDLNVSPAVFYDQIKFIRTNFEVISPDQLIRLDVPDNAAMITFDDGFKSYFSEAVPIMTNLSIPSIIFLNMGPILGDVFWSGLITYLCDYEQEYINLITEKVPERIRDSPLYLNCSIELVESYRNSTQQSFTQEVNEFVGDLANEDDLLSASSNEFVYFGNHLFNHYVPKHLSNHDLLYYYEENKEALKKYKNYRNMFSFPFGQPELCFSKDQIELLIPKYTDFIFSGYPMVNLDATAKYLDRISLYDFNKTPSQIWFNILRNSFRL